MKKILCCLLLATVSCGVWPPTLPPIFQPTPAPVMPLDDPPKNLTAEQVQLLMDVERREIEAKQSAVTRGITKAVERATATPDVVPPPYAPLTDYSTISLRLGTNPFTFCRGVTCTQTECNAGQQACLFALEDVMLVARDIPDCQSTVRSAEQMFSTITGRLNVDYRVREVLPKGIALTPGDTRNLQNSKGYGWACKQFDRFYGQCPSFLAKFRTCLTSTKSRPLAGGHPKMNAEVEKALDLRVVNGSLGTFCIGGAKDGTACSSNSTCTGGRCQGALFEIPLALEAFDKTKFLLGLLSSNTFAPLPTAEQRTLLDAIAAAHEASSDRMCGIPTPSAGSAVTLHHTLEATAISNLQRALFQIDPFVGGCDPKWSKADCCTLFRIAHRDHHCWDGYVRKGDVGGATMASSWHEGDHLVARFKSETMQLRPPCGLMRQGLMDYQTCPNQTARQMIDQYREAHPEHVEAMRKVGLL